MKIVKWILIVVVVFIAIPLIIALFLKKDYTVEKQVTINKSKQVVFDYIRYLKNQDNFSKWAKMDPQMKKDYRGTDATVGFVSAWSSDKKDVGQGEQEIKDIKEGERIDYEIRFIKPFTATSQAYITTESVAPEQTKVKWTFNGHMPYPMNIMLLCMNMDEMVGNDLQIGLDNLKAILEKQ